jgi:lipopolysaccharide assembly protein A
MRTFFLLIKATVGVTAFVLLLGFAVKNTDSVTVRYFLGLEWQAPLVFVLLVFFTLGIVLGVMASLGVIVSQRRQILGLKRELRGGTRTAVAPTAAERA